MAKKIDGYINLQVPAGQANPSPPIGPALGQRGLAIMEFCKQFNAKTKDLEQGAPIPVKITVRERRTAIHARRPPTIAAVTVPIATPATRGSEALSERMAVAYPPTPASAPTQRNS